MSPESDLNAKIRAQDILKRPEFKSLMAQQRMVSLTLTALMLSLYFGFILLIAYRKDLLAQRIGEHLTVGLPLGVGLILATCLLTGIYVNWANTRFDREATALKARIVAPAQEDER